MDRAARPSAALTAEEVRAFCQGQIAHYKVPRYMKLVDGFPHDGHGQGPEVS